MFGYVTINKPELKIREYEFYRSTYCGLCHSMGKCTGQCSRMTLSYDFAFLALVRIALTDEQIEFGKKRCLAHPFSKHSYMKNNATLEYCSGAAALLNYHKVRDDLADEKGIKKLFARLALPFVAYGRKKALKKGLSDLDEKISEGLLKLSGAEKRTPESVNLPAGIFGEILGNIMSHGLCGKEAKIANALGVAVGKWIYIADALDDWEKDAKRRRYNPFILLYKKNAPSEEDLGGIKTALENELVAADAAIDLIDFNNKDIENIISNILRSGLSKRIDEIRFESIHKKQDQHKE